MKKVLVVFLGIVLGTSAMADDVVVASVDSVMAVKPVDTFVEIYLNDLPSAIGDKLAQMGDMVKQAFYSYSGNGSRIYKVLTVNSSMENEVRYFTEDGKWLN